MYKSPANTLFVGKNVVYVPECHSTNTLATQLSQNSHASEGTVVIAHHQTAGRGQRGNDWKAQPGQNITMSVILQPGFLPIRHQFYLNIITALALHDLLAEVLHSDISIKWPNDILVHGNKICGILIESQLHGHRLQHAIVGIGLNVNQEDFGGLKATSMAIVAKRQFDLQGILDLLPSFLEARYLQLKQNKLDALKTEYLQRLYRRGQVHRYETGQQAFDGEIVGVDEDGRLAINVESQIRYFQVKEVRYL